MGDWEPTGQKQSQGSHSEFDKLLKAQTFQNLNKHDFVEKHFNTWFMSAGLHSDKRLFPQNSEHAEFMF